MKFILTVLLLSGTALAQTQADALDALRGLKSATEVGISLRDYAPRVVDAKVKVDKYLATDPKDAAQVEATMKLYILALQAWSIKVQKKGSCTPMAEEILASSELSSCPAMQDLITLARKEAEKEKEPLPRWLGYHLFTSQSALWRCASEKLASLKQP